MFIAAIWAAVHVDLNAQTYYVTMKRKKQMRSSETDAYVILLKLIYDSLRYSLWSLDI